MRLAALAFSALVATLSPQQAEFRARTNAVVVDVSVRTGGRTVAGLTAADFELRDAGVLQKVELVERDRLPLDVTLLVDVSVSIANRPVGVMYRHLGSITQWIETASSRVGETFDARDRVEVLRFASAIQPSGSPSGPIELSADDIRRRLGRTALLDAMTTAMMRPQATGFRRAILVVSDGRDTASVIDEQLQLAIADRSDGVLYLIAIGGRTPLRPQPVRWVDGYHAHLAAMTSRTGGRMFAVDPGLDATAALREALDDLRSRYILTYLPENVPPAGWHEIELRTKDRKYEVTARRGYWRDR